jgi:DNA-binding MarR family transcriptional regulator
LELACVLPLEFAKALAPLKLSPPNAGILRILARTPGINLQELAKRVDMHASSSLGGAAIAY